MFSADFGGGALGEFFAAEHPTWEEYGRSGEPFFPQTATSITTSEQVGTPDVGMYGYEQVTVPPILGAGYSALTGTLGAIPAVVVGSGRSQEGDLVDEAQMADQEGALPAAIDYISDIPGEVGEAGGELVGNLLGGALAPLTAAPGDLFEGIPTWVPLLGAAFLLTRK